MKTQCVSSNQITNQRYEQLVKGDNFSHSSRKKAQGHCR